MAFILLNTYFKKLLLCENYLFGGLRESHDALGHQQGHSGSRNGANRLQEVGPGPVVTSLAPATWPAQDDGVGLQTAQTNCLHPETKVFYIKKANKSKLDLHVAQTLSNVGCGHHIGKALHLFFFHCFFQILLGGQHFDHIWHIMT